MHWSLLWQRPLWAWFSQSWSMDLGVGLPTHHDVKLIETNHATQDGRTKNIMCRHQVGRLLTCRSGIHEGMFRGAIGKSKERCKRTRKRTAIQSITSTCFINPKNTATAVPDKGTYSRKNKPGIYPLDGVASFRDGPTSANSGRRQVAEVSPGIIDRCA